MAYNFTDSELDALTQVVLRRLRDDLESKCDCPLHLMTVGERAAVIDRAIEETNEQVRRGEIPGARFVDRKIE